MRRLSVVVLLSLLAAPHVFADSQDTVVFRTRMLPDNEVPPIAAAGNSASATITVHVSRDEKANVNAATVTFDIDYTITSALTFTGLHIHNGPVGVNALASSIAEDRGTIEDLYEPYLIQIGFLQRTPRGRVASNLAYEHLGYKHGAVTRQPGLF